MWKETRQRTRSGGLKGSWYVLRVLPARGPSGQPAFGNNDDAAVVLSPAGQRDERAAAADQRDALRVRVEWREHDGVHVQFAQGNEFDGANRIRVHLSARHREIEGVAGGGADAWTWQEVLAEGVSVGAPPDAFNSQGQDWGSPPLVPWRLRDADYEPFVQSIRATIAGAGGLRVDHVMGLFRLWWVPSDGSAADGAYVRYPAEDLLDIVALESHRAQALVVGEDLGTVEDGVREAMEEHGVLSYRLLWFEDDDPAEWPATSMAAITTHDLPTVAGLWTGDDLVEQREQGTGTSDELERGRTSLLGHLPGLAADATAEQAVERAHQLLARAPSTLLSATLDDAVGEVRRPNMPGAADRPNWSLPLPVVVEDLPAHPLLRKVARILADG